MIWKFSHAIMSIFFDMSTHGEESKNLYNPQDLTDHYRKEISTMSMDGLYIATHYGSIRHTIEAYKYRSDRQHVSVYVDLLSKLVEQYCHSSLDSDVAIVGVPMHWSRYMIRGFSHIDLLSRRLVSKIGIPSIRPIQAGFSRRQSKLSKSKRLKNRENNFSLIPGVSLPKTVILIDDIISTGSTANACAKILKEAWVERVYAIFLASNQ